MYQLTCFAFNFKSFHASKTNLLLPTLKNSFASITTPSFTPSKFLFSQPRRSNFRTFQQHPFTNHPSRPQLGLLAISSIPPNSDRGLYLIFLPPKGISLRREGERLSLSLLHPLLPTWLEGNGTKRKEIGLLPER
ncbi:hypothetical protein AVEN_29326-1 [Araneus ventricosus]|uniref:Uncharacterized protein n=1 Tax=Araneus ventricosus TaxID=182803 RepID=A0A4Y2IX93_ARAVE|nr:hypothetical protein AVEN_29326-1 [Araneus ventricosus]